MGGRWLCTCAYTYTSHLLTAPPPTIQKKQTHTPRRSQAAAKAAKQGRGALVLGVGVREFKDWLLAGQGQQGGNNGSGALDLTAAALVCVCIWCIYICMSVVATTSHPTPPT